MGSVCMRSLEAHRTHGLRNHATLQHGAPASNMHRIRFAWAGREASHRTSSAAFLAAWAHTDTISDALPTCARARWCHAHMTTHTLAVTRAGVGRPGGATARWKQSQCTLGRGWGEPIPEQSRTSPGPSEPSPACLCTRARMRGWMRQLRADSRSCADAGGRCARESCPQREAWTTASPVPVQWRRTRHVMVQGVSAVAGASSVSCTSPGADLGSGRAQTRCTCGQWGMHPVRVQMRARGDSQYDVQHT
jgi:hypothetical protein